MIETEKERKERINQEALKVTTLVENCAFASKVQKRAWLDRNYASLEEALNDFKKLLYRDL